MLLHTLDNILALKPEKTVVVLGHQAERASAILPQGVITALQKEQLGTAHAAMAGLKKLASFEGTLLLVSGDPLEDLRTLRAVNRVVIAGRVVDVGRLVKGAARKAAVKK